MNLKKRFTLIIGALVMIMASNFNLVAQDAEITDDELKLYATVMGKIDGMKAEMKTKYNALIKNEESMNGGRRFKEIKSAKGDEAKLAEINVTEEEMSIFNKIQEEYASMTKEFKATYPTLIKDELGAGVYNKVKKALKSDSDLKEKYDTIVASLQSQDVADESEE